MISVLIERHVIDGGELSQIDRKMFEVEALLPFLQEYFGEWPENARLYHEDVSLSTDVTPHTAAEVDALAEMPGPFTVVVLPATGFEVQLILFAVSLIAQTLFAPDVPNTAERTVRNESPNNGLSERANQVRVNGRIPDIFGQVRSVPDVIQLAYNVFENHIEKEIGYLLVGKGAYDIPATEIKDDTTPTQEISGTSVEIYAPFTSPNSGHAPQLRIGNPINTPVLMAQRLQSVNGQVMLAPNAGGSYRNDVQFSSPNVVTSLNPAIDYTAMFVTGDQIVISDAAQAAGRYTYSTTITAQSGPGSVNGTLITMGDVTPNWTAGQVLTVSASSLPYTIPGGESSDQTGFISIDGPYTIVSVAFTPGTGGDPGYTEIVLANVHNVSGGWYTVGLTGGGTSAGPAILSRASGDVQFDLSGTYTVNTVTSSVITLNAPAGVNPDWDVLATSYGGVSQVLQPTLATTGERWIGEFTLDSLTPITQIITNFVALGGLYALGANQQQFAREVYVEMEATPINAAGTPIGATETFEGIVVGSATSRSTRALTMYANVAAVSKRWRIRARRLSPYNDDGRLNVVDEIKWRDVYGVSPVAQYHFGDVTTVQTVTLATDGALAVKERKLNMLVTRKLPRRISGPSFTTELYPTKNVADILSFVCLDPYIGNRSPSEIDFDNFYNVAEDIVNYFGFPEAAQFCYTFDNNDMSAEEMISVIATAVFCNAYRRGSTIRLFFQRENPDSSLLFNHRNKLPGSETRNVQFGPITDFDGVEYQYVDPTNDAIVTLYRPEDRSSINPKTVESVGVRDPKQASLQAWREYNRLLYQNTTTEFEALPEADLLILNDRVLVADNTRTASYDGEIIDVVGLEVTLSQPMDWEAGQTYTMHLQNADLAVEPIPVVMGQTRRQAVLARPPRVPIVYEDDKYVRTTYVIVKDSDERNATPFILTEKDPSEDGLHVTVTAVNYDPMYYEHDGDFRA